MSMLYNNSGTAYALVYIMVTLLVVGVSWIILGLVVDEFDLVATDLVSHDMWGSKTTDGVNDLKTCWNLVLWLTVGCGFLYAIVSAIRKERGGIIHD